MRTGENTLWALVVLIYLILALHIVAEVFFLYWTYTWYDLVMHFLGGLWLSLALLWMAQSSGYLKTEPTAVPALLSIVCGVLLIGLLWEVFEYFTNIFFSIEFKDGYVFDTILDVTMDFLGGGTGYFVYRQLLEAPVSQPE